MGSMRSILGFSAVAILIALPAFVSAQSLGAEPLTISVSPQYPEPYQTVVVTPRSTLIDLSASTVTVSVNGTVIKEGTGGESTSFTVGGAGEAMTIKVVAVGPEGTFEQALVIRPSGVALVVEPSSTTHPFYLGASLVAPEGNVRIIALAEMRSSAGGAPIAASSLVYNWKIGDRLLQAQSGIGRSTLAVTAPLQYRDATVTVTVTDQAGTGAGQASVRLTPATPMLLVYRDGPLFGPHFDHAIEEDIVLNGDEESFRAVPYYFAQRPAFSWSVNGAPNGNESVITVRTTGGGSGTAQLSVDAALPDTYVSMTESFGIRFGESSPFNFFGLL